MSAQASHSHLLHQLHCQLQDLRTEYNVMSEGKLYLIIGDRITVYCNYLEGRFR